jgi:hypothetical protein
VSGAWALKGTRIPVAAIFENLEAGVNVHNIATAYVTEGVIGFEGLDELASVGQSVDAFGEEGWSDSESLLGRPSQQACQSKGRNRTMPQTAKKSEARRLMGPRIGVRMGKCCSWRTVDNW